MSKGGRKIRNAMIIDSFILGQKVPGKNSYTCWLFWLFHNANFKKMPQPLFFLSNRIIHKCVIVQFKQLDIMLQKENNKSMMCSWIKGTRVYNCFTRTPFHSDVLRSHSWSANICGSKRWIFFPPGDQNRLKMIKNRLQSIL